MRACSRPSKALPVLLAPIVMVLPVVLFLAVLVLPGPAAAQSVGGQMGSGQMGSGQTGDIPAEAMTRLQALDRITRGQGTGTCFTRDQAMAVETHRVYAQLLVAALACGRRYGVADGYAAYVGFSDRQEDLLMETQGTLERYLGGTPAFDEYVSRLANEQSQMLSRFGTDRYCEINRSRFSSLIDASPDSVRNYMEDLGLRLYARQRGC